MKGKVLKLNQLKTGLRYVCIMAEKIQTRYGESYILSLANTTDRVYANHKLSTFIEEHPNASFAFTLSGIHTFRKRNEYGEEGAEITYVKVDDIKLL